jgi:hypothetical protein
MSADSAHVDADGVELRKEACTMAFYVAICLIAALVAVEPRNGIPILGVIWGTTVGLALAHLFAFRLAARLVGGGSVGRDQARLALASLLGATAVAVIASAPVLVVSDPAEADGVRFFVSALIGVPAYHVGRHNGTGRPSRLLSRIRPEIMQPTRYDRRTEQPQHTIDAEPPLRAERGPQRAVHDETVAAADGWIHAEERRQRHAIKHRGRNADE